MVTIISSSTIASVPNKPAVYALMGGSGKSQYVAYVGIAGNLRQRIVQHLVLRDSSVATGTTAACLNPDYVTEVRWWLHKKLKKTSQRVAAELVALEILNPVLRSKALPSAEAKRLFADEAFHEEMRTLFSQAPAGTLEIPSLQSVVKRLERIEARLDRLTEALSRRGP